MMPWEPVPYSEDRYSLYEAAMKRARRRTIEDITSAIYTLALCYITGVWIFLEYTL